MTNKEITASAIVDPAVVRANTRVGGQGQPVYPSTARLLSMANVALQGVMQGLLLDQSIRRELLEREYELTTTSAAEYELPEYIARVIYAVNDSNDRPIRVFESRSDHDRWYYKHYGGTTSTGGPHAMYQSGYGAHGEVKITFSPSIGDESMIRIGYIRRIKSPLKMSVFPEETHTVILVGVINWMTGGQFKSQFEELKTDMARSLDVIAGGPQVLRKPRRARRIISRNNAIVRGGGYLGPSLPH